MRNIIFGVWPSSVLIRPISLFSNKTDLPGVGVGDINWTVY